MEQTEVMEYLKQHPFTIFHFRTHHSVGTITTVDTVPEQVYNPVMHTTTTYFRTVRRKIELTDFMASVVPDSLHRDVPYFTIVLQQPHYTESARNWISIRYDNIVSIEATH